MKCKTMQKLKEKSNRRPAKIAFVCIAVLVMIVTIGVVIAKYTRSFDKYLDVLSSDFYFTSDYLTEEVGEELTVYTDTATFQIFNTNWGNRSSKDITYSVTAKRITANGVESDITSELVFSSDYEGDSQTTLVTTEAADAFTFSGELGDRVEVTAVSSYPFEKTLKAAFVFNNPTKDSFYEVEDRGYYCVLRLYIGRTSDDADPQQSLTINHEGLIPDTASHGIDKDKLSNTADQNTVTVKANAYYELVFFDSSYDDKDYTVSERTKIENWTVTLTPKA